MCVNISSPVPKNTHVRTVYVKKLWSMYSFHFHFFISYTKVVMCCVNYFQQYFIYDALLNVLANCISEIMPSKAISFSLNFYSYHSNVVVIFTTLHAQVQSGFGWSKNFSITTNNSSLIVLMRTINSQARILILTTTNIHIYFYSLLQLHKLHILCQTLIHKWTNDI